MKNTIVLDLTGCKYIMHMHKIIKETIGFPDWYGNNWDAFWDMGYDYIPENAHIVIRGTKTMPKELEKDIKLLSEVLDDIHKEASPTITYEIES